MIVTRLLGGLGNQMFQYAVGRHLSIVHGVPLLLDITGLQQGSERTYSLGNYKITASIASSEVVKSFEYVRFSKRKNRYLKALEWLFGEKQAYYTEKSFNYDPHVLKQKNNTYLDGYWQSERYFLGICQQIRQDLQLKAILSKQQSDIKEDILATNAISVHVRRGDYLTNPDANRILGVLDSTYYEKAILKIASLLRKPIFFVFSDDLHWCKENLDLGLPTIFVDNGNGQDWEDLELMSTCKHHIIANSSFSWWGAWRNNNPNKIVIAPSRWFRDTTYDTRDLLPDRWVTL